MNPVAEFFDVYQRIKSGDKTVLAADARRVIHMFSGMGDYLQQRCGGSNAGSGTVNLAIESGKSEWNTVLAFLNK